MSFVIDRRDLSSFFWAYTKLPTSASTNHIIIILLYNGARKTNVVVILTDETYSLWWWTSVKRSCIFDVTAQNWNIYIYTFCLCVCLFEIENVAKEEEDEKKEIEKTQRTHCKRENGWLWIIYQVGLSISRRHGSLRENENPYLLQHSYCDYESATSIYYTYTHNI